MGIITLEDIAGLLSQLLELLYELSEESNQLDDQSLEQKLME